MKKLLKYTKHFYSTSINKRTGTLPDFLILGAQRGGTTSLYNYLIKHPQILPAKRKELHFFDSNYYKGIDWYRSQFSSRLKIKIIQLLLNKKIVSGEATPMYLFHPYASKRILQILPQAKFIILLRNPIERAYSQYQLQVKKGFEKYSFEEALKREENRLQDEIDKIAEHAHYQSFNLQHFSYLSRGIYVNQLKRWFQHFPQNQFFIRDSHAFYEDPNWILHEIYCFLEISGFANTEFEKHNAGQYFAMKKRTRKFLVDFYEPYNQELYDLLGVDFGWETKNK